MVMSIADKIDVGPEPVDYDSVSFNRLYAADRIVSKAKGGLKIVSHDIINNTLRQCESGILAYKELTKRYSDRTDSVET